MGVESCRASPAPPVGRPVYGTPDLGHGLRRPNFVPKFGASVKSSCPTADSSCCGAQNSLLACAHRILTAATPFCSLLPPLAALANVPLCTREPLGRGCGSPRRFAPRNDGPKPLSFRGGPTGRRGNPSFLRWTGVRAAVPRAWPPPTKFRPEIWGVGQVVGPYGSDVGRTGQFKM